MNSDANRHVPASPGSALIHVDELAREIDTRIRALPDPRTDSVRAVRREFSRRLSKATPEEVIDLALVLIREYGRRSVAHELVHHHRPALQSLGSGELEELGQGIDSWWAVDGFATLIAGPAWREDQVPDQVIDDWAHSSDRWWRRTALVSTVALNVKARGGAGDVPRTLRVCSLLVGDHDDMSAGFWRNTKQLWQRASSERSATNLLPASRTRAGRCEGAVLMGGGPAGRAITSSVSDPPGRPAG